MTARGDVRRAAITILVAAVSAQVSVSALQQGLPALGPILQSTFDLDTTATGFMLGIGSLGTAIAVLGWGRLTDHTTDRRVALLGLALTSGALVFAGIGAQLTIAGVPIIDSGTYSAVVIMVILTTLVTPPALVASMRRNSRPT